MKELYLCGDEEHIDVVINFVKNKDLLYKDGLFLIDLLPELKENYMEKNGIMRDCAIRGQVNMAYGTTTNSELEDDLPWIIVIILIITALVFVRVLTGNV